MAVEKQTKTVTPSSVKETPVAQKAAPAPKKPAAEKPVAEKAAPKKTVAEKAVAKKAAPKKTVAKKAAAKKPAAKKAEPKKTVETVVIQAAGNEWDVTAIKERAIADYVAAGHRKSGVSSVTVYIKPEERKAYYVINDKDSGSVDI